VTAYSFDFRLYQRPFRLPLKTHHGSWEIREGIILRLVDDRGKMGWGEIAPLSWFGSETLQQALAFCQQLEDKCTAEDIQKIPDDLPACQFGFESALEDLFKEKSNLAKGFQYSHLLPAGEAALNAWRIPWQSGGKTFKWKIGVQAIATEIDRFLQLIEQLPEGVKLRLDANGGLSFKQAQEWLAIADKTERVEFIEQPLPSHYFEEMLALSHDYTTPLALDESVATLKQLEACYQKGWREIYVIKAAIAGSPKRLRQVCRQYSLDLVFSSVFETRIAREAAIELAAELSGSDRALGFGIHHWFEGDEGQWLESLWKTY
jgi:O-succinylbenzoate synthase